MNGPRPRCAVREAALLRRWDRLGMGVRCGLHPSDPARLRLYLEAGRRIAAAGVRLELAVQLRMLTVLLQSARDEGLPWFWRSVCLEHTAWPRARIEALLAPHDPLAFAAVDAAWQSAQRTLPALPPAG